ncbi:hypothetical protein LJK87_34470 [Paenibacillus sp. P25]|nr:hypothetical protein LJK87_34470 [Paenibacillus sp. P25]
MESNYSSVPLNQTAVETALRRASFLRRHRAPLIALLSVFVSLFSLTMAFHAFIAWKLARPQIDPLRSNPAKAIGLSYQDVTFPSLDGASRLSGWYIPATTAAAGASANRQTVVFSHGYGGNREEIWVPLYDLAKAAHQMGFNVLMFDYGYVQPKLTVTGGSGNRRSCSGLSGMPKIRARRKYSSGASPWAQAPPSRRALQTKDIDGMILDSTFILEPDTLYHNMKQEANLPKFSQTARAYVFPAAERGEPEPDSVYEGKGNAVQYSDLLHPWGKGS